MKKNDFKNELLSFIENSTCSFTCIEEIKKVLDNSGFTELKEQDNWNLNKNKYYVIRDDASIVAFYLPNNKCNKFSIITTHLDTPSLLLKPNGAYVQDNYLKYNIMPYGGLLNYGWLDHPLSLAGRIITEKNNELKTHIIDFKRPMLVVPSVAIHQKTDANTNLDLDMQIDLQPIIGLAKSKESFLDILKEIIKDKIISYDLFAYNTYKPTLVGLNNELLISPRIDNLTSVYTALDSFINTNASNIKVFTSFNNEETGSLTEEGADSNFLIDILKRIAASLNIDISQSLANSFIISSDNTHAIHPNHPEYSDTTGASLLDKGITLIKEPSSTTNALSLAIIKYLCNKNKIKYQEATAKNTISGGSTLSGISLRHVSVLSIDIGIPELSMHSSLETCSINDVFELNKLMKVFYESDICIKKGNIIIN